MDGLKGLVEGMYKARSGLIRVFLRIGGGRIMDIIISGDFILTPEHYIDEMQDLLRGVDTDRDTILGNLRKFYKENDFQSPETYPEDFTEAIMRAVDKSSELRKGE